MDKVSFEVFNIEIARPKKKETRVMTTEKSDWLKYAVPWRFKTHDAHFERNYKFCGEFREHSFIFPYFNRRKAIRSTRT